LHLVTRGGTISNIEEARLQASMNDKNYENSGLRVNKVNTALSVTNGAVPVENVTLEAGESASTRYQRLRPWLGLANLLGKPDRGKVGPFLTLEYELKWGVREAFPSESPEDFYRRFSGLSEAPELKDLLSGYQLFNPYVFKRLQMLAMDVAVALDEISTWTEIAPDDQQYVFQLRASVVQIEVQDDQIVCLIHNPLQEFLDTLKVLDYRRIRRCPICGHLFYAARFDKKACSTRCNGNRRVRRSREKERERVLELAGRVNDPAQISKELGVPDVRVRRLLKTQKEKA
jgi:hypothetical protein